ncbi:MAG: hypothetical protein D6797_06825 [Bdellovibrio sp.]|nr:MAG: hypothetical protein D6797_06825 [Bdellovibrio sp.]
MKAIRNAKLWRTRIKNDLVLIAFKTLKVSKPLRLSSIGNNRFFLISQKTSFWGVVYLAFQ